MNYKEKMTSLYEKVSATLSNQYNIDYLAISEAIECIGEAWKKEAVLINISDAYLKTDNPYLSDLYSLKADELADLITEAKCAMLDINQYCDKYKAEKVFDINISTSPKEIMGLIHNMLDDVLNNKERIEEIPVNEIVVPLEYLDKDININWELIIMEKYGDFFQEKQEEYLTYEYDPETEEISVSEEDCCL